MYELYKIYSQSYIYFLLKLKIQGRTELIKYFLRSCIAVLLIIESANVSAQEKTSIKIGWSGPLSGNSAVLGLDSLTAVKLVIDRINKEGGLNGIKLELIAEDDQYDAAKSVKAYSKLALVDKCEVIFTNTYAGLFATAERAQKDGVILINPLDCNDKIAELPKSTLCIATQSESVGIAIADEIIKRKQKPTAIFYDETNPFMNIVEKVISEKLEQSGEPVKFKAAIQSNTSDFRTSLMKAKLSKVKSLVLLGHDPMGQAMREARQLGIDSQFYTVGTITSPGFQALAGSAAEGTLVAYWEAPRSDLYLDFIEQFMAVTSRAPILELASIPSYDSAMIVVEALRRSIDKEAKVNKKALLQALYETKNYQGLSGTISIDEDGAVRSIKERIYEFSNAQLNPAN
jgi:branched-chain amino acid transport system substrate-binding protein